MLKKRKREGEQPPTEGLESNEDVKYLNSPHFNFCDNSYLADSYTTLLYSILHYAMSIQENLSNKNCNPIDQICKISK